MKRLIALLITITAFLSAKSQDASNGIKEIPDRDNLSLPNYDLQACLDYAIENSQVLQNSVYEIDKAKSKVGEVRAVGLPQIEAGLTVNYNYEVRKTLLPFSTFGGGDSTVPGDPEVALAFGTPYDGDFGFRASQLLFDGSYFVGLSAAKTYRELASKQFQQTRIDVVDAVFKAYYLVLVNREKLKASESNTERLKSLLDETQKMYEAGFAEEIDVKRIRVNYNNLAVSTRVFERAVVVSEYLLKYQMGMPVNERIRITGDLNGVKEILEKKPEVGNFQYQDRIEYSVLETNRNLKHLEVKNTNVQYLPSLYLIGTLGWNTNAAEASQLTNFSDRWLSNGLIGIQMTIPIFDGLRKKYQIEQSKIDLMQIENNNALLENSINTEVRQSVDGLQASMDQLIVQEENMNLAKEVYDVSRTKFQEGVGSNIELINADDSYITAQVDYYDALYTAILSKISLEKSLGKLDYTK